MRLCSILMIVFSLWLAGPAYCRSQKSPPMNQIEEVLKMQVSAWNRGDLDAFMTGYMNSSQTSYISGDVELHGYNALKERYEKRYGIRSSTMGKLAFADVNILPLSPESALCTGHWQVEVPNKPKAHGVFSLIFVLSGGDWKIIHDHTTAQSDKP